MVNAKYNNNRQPNTLSGFLVLSQGWYSNFYSSNVGLGPASIVYPSSISSCIVGVMLFSE